MFSMDELLENEAGSMVIRTSFFQENLGYTKLDEMEKYVREVPSQEVIGLSKEVWSKAGCKNEKS